MSSFWELIKTEFWLDLWTWIAGGLTAAWIFSTNVRGIWYWLPYFSGSMLAMSFTATKATAWLSLVSETMAKAAQFLSVATALVAIGYVFFFGRAAHLVVTWCKGPEGETKCKFNPHGWEVTLASLLIIAYSVVAYQSLKHAAAVGLFDTLFPWL